MGGFCRRVVHFLDFSSGFRWCNHHMVWNVVLHMTFLGITDGVHFNFALYTTLQSTLVITPTINNAFSIYHMCICKMANCNLVCNFAVAVETELHRYHHKLQRTREKRVKHCHEMSCARYQCFLTMKRLLTLLA